MNNFQAGGSRRKGNLVIFLMVIAQWGVPFPASADDGNRRVDVGVLFRFMPTGWIDASEHSPPDIRALPDDSGEVGGVAWHGG